MAHRFTSKRDFRTYLDMSLDDQFFGSEFELWGFEITIGKGKTRKIHRNNLVTCDCCDHIWWNKITEVAELLRENAPVSGWIFDTYEPRSFGIIPRTIVILIDD